MSLSDPSYGHDERNHQVVFDQRCLMRRHSCNARVVGDSSRASVKQEEEAGLVVITRPKGGRKPICMDLDEVRACRDLGLELERESVMPTFAATINPGDDPREVKARLKIWAQAVALASSTSHFG